MQQLCDLVYGEVNQNNRVGCTRIYACELEEGGLLSLKQEANIFNWHYQVRPKFYRNCLGIVQQISLPKIRAKMRAWVFQPLDER